MPAAVGSLLLCFAMALLLQQPPPDHAVGLGGPWAGRRGARPPAGLLGKSEGLFFPAMEGKTHPWNESLQQWWHGSNGRNPTSGHSCPQC